MVNKDRIVPVTRTDLVTLFCTVYNMSHEDQIGIVPVVDGAPAFVGPIPPAATAVLIAAEPIKTIGEIPEVAAFYFLPAYDFETEVQYYDGDGNKFVPNPGVLYIAGEGSIIEVATGFEYGPAEP